MAPPSPEKKMIALKSKDGQTFAVEEATARMSEALEKIEDDSAAGEIALTDVDSATLAKMLEYCSYSAGVSAAAAQGKDVNPQDFDKNYVDSVKDDQEMLFNLIVASYHLDIKPPLLDLMCQTVASMVKADCREKRGTLSTEIDAFISEKLEDDFTSEEFGGWPFEK